MISLLRGTWALYLGIALFMVGNGLQGTLLGVRGDIEQRVGSAARAAVEGRQARLTKSREALARLEGLDALWRERLHGETS